MSRQNPPADRSWFRHRDRLAYQTIAEFPMALNLPETPEKVVDSPPTYTMPTE